MALTYTKISSVTLTGNQSAIDFTSIPNTYTHLLIKLSLDGLGYNATTGLITFNGGASSFNYRKVFKDGASTTATLSTDNGAANIPLEMGGGTNTTASCFGPNQIFIANYTSSTNKITSIEFGTEANTNDKWVGWATGWWTGTGVINQVTITGSANWIADSTAVLYGILQA
jgi:hypothetical protein